MIDIRTGEFVFVQAQAVLLATGGGPTMYKYHTPSGDKTCDGMAMALRAGLTLRDMEMVQFHPTGLIAGPHTRITGTIIEEGLRGAGGHLLNGQGERFMHLYDKREERATRDIVSRAMFDQMRQGKVSRAAASTSRCAISIRPWCARCSKAWSSAARTAASISCRASSMSCRRPIT